MAQDDVVGRLIWFIEGLAGDLYPSGFLGLGCWLLKARSPVAEQQRAKSGAPVSVESSVFNMCRCVPSGAPEVAEARQGILFAPGSECRRRATLRFDQLGAVVALVYRYARI